MALLLGALSAFNAPSAEAQSHPLGNPDQTAGSSFHGTGGWVAVEGFTTGDNNTAATYLDTDRRAVEAQGLRLNGAGILKHSPTAGAAPYRASFSIQSGGKADDVAPTLSSATVNGRVLTLAYDETLADALGAGWRRTTPSRWTEPRVT